MAAYGLDYVDYGAPNFRYSGSYANPEMRSGYDFTFMGGVRGYSRSQKRPNWRTARAGYGPKLPSRPPRPAPRYDQREYGPPRGSRGYGRDYGYYPNHEVFGPAPNWDFGNYDLRPASRLSRSRFRR